MLFLPFVYFLKLLRRLEGELGEDWRILGDVSSLPRRTRHALKPKKEETKNILDTSHQDETEGKFGMEPVQLMKRSVVCKEELLPTTRKSNWQSNSKPGGEEGYNCAL